MKYHGNVGYFETIEKKPGLYEEGIIFHESKGDVLRNNKRISTSNSINPIITISDQISIVADPYARGHFFNIRCIEYQGALWSVTEVDASQPPRLILSLGGLYNENME